MLLLLFVNLSHRQQGTLGHLDAGRLVGLLTPRLEKPGSSSPSPKTVSARVRVSPNPNLSGFGERD